MATPGELMDLTAACLGMPVASVVGYDRQLADAGLRTKGGRGRHVAQVSARDAAHLLTAILGGGQVKDSVSTVQRYSETEPHTFTSSRGGFKALGVPDLANLPQRHSFVDALEVLILAIVRGAPALVARREPKRIGKVLLAEPMIEVAALTPGTVGELRFGAVHGRSAHVRYALPNPFSSKTKVSQKEVASWQARIKVRAESDLEQFRKISERTLWKIGELLAD
jgi:hypothetical protein